MSETACEKMKNNEKERERERKRFVTTERTRARLKNDNERVYERKVMERWRTEYDEREKDSGGQKR